MVEGVEGKQMRMNKEGEVIVCREECEYKKANQVRSTDENEEREQAKMRGRGARARER